MKRQLGIFMLAVTLGLCACGQQETKSESSKEEMTVQADISSEEVNAEEENVTEELSENDDEALDGAEMEEPEPLDPSDPANVALLCVEAINQEQYIWENTENRTYSPLTHADGTVEKIEFIYQRERLFDLERKISFYSSENIADDPLMPHYIYAEEFNSIWNTEGKWSIHPNSGFTADSSSLEVCKELLRKYSENPELKSAESFGESWVFASEGTDDFSPILSFSLFVDPTTMLPLGMEYTKGFYPDDVTESNNVLFRFIKKEDPSWSDFDAKISGISDIKAELGISESSRKEVDLQSTLPGEEWMKELVGCFDEPRLVIFNDATNKKVVVEPEGRIDFARDDSLGVVFPNYDRNKIVKPDDTTFCYTYYGESFYMKDISGRFDNDATVQTSFIVKSEGVEYTLTATLVLK